MFLTSVQRGDTDATCHHSVVFRASLNRFGLLSKAPSRARPLFTSCISVRHTAPSPSSRRLRRQRMSGGARIACDATEAECSAWGQSPQKPLAIEPLPPWSPKRCKPPHSTSCPRCDARATIGFRGHAGQESVAASEVWLLVDFHLSTRLLQLLFCLFSILFRDPLLYCFWKR